MNVTKTDLPGVVLIEPRLFRDERGFFLEIFHTERFAEHGLPSEFLQDNQSRSVRGVLRGLHYQLRRPQGKLVMVMRGEIYDVAVDIRRGSPTFGRFHGVTLNADERALLWIPPGFAHGFCVTSDVADVLYKCTDVYQADDDYGVLWNDPGIGIPWPVKDPLLSAKDKLFRTLDPSRDDLPTYRSCTACDE